jgi:D-hydroxyproline dehydrogenase subunit gamma
MFFACEIKVLCATVVGAMPQPKAFQCRNSGLFFPAAMFRKLHDPVVTAVTVYVDGAPVAAEANESIAAVLLRQQPTWSRTTPVSDTRRAPYCMMGVCFDCLATVDGAPSIQTCLAQVRHGMRIDRQRGRPGVTS